MQRKSTHLDVISDHSKENLSEVPDEVLDMSNLKMLFLEGNLLTQLPDTIFYMLPKLMWLDLRNNLLESIPKSIANHKHLENLLLSNNNLRELPNELGAVPNLKALQVSENPLVYPVRRIVTEGTKAIKNYLKQEYERLIQLSKKEEKDDVTFIEDEELINTVERDSNDDVDVIEKPPTPSELKKKREPMIDDIIERVKKKLSDPFTLQPTVNVKKIAPLAPPAPPPPPPLPPPPLVARRKYDESLKFVHKVSREGSKISLRSCFNKVGMRPDMSKTEEKSLREGWLNQLRILLNDQERILQQERNLRALTEWRIAQKKRTETPKRFFDDGLPPPPEEAAPYATYPEYSKMPTRQELAAQLNDFLKEKSVSKAGLNKGHSLNIEKLINDLVEQIKEMENAYSATRSPRSEMEQAGRQIKTITDIHKKLLSLKKSNDLSV